MLTAGVVVARGEISPHENALTLVHESDGVQIHHRQIGGSAYLETREVSFFPATPVEVFSVLTDYDKFADFIPSLKMSRIISREANKVWVHQVMSFPTPIADREFVVRVTLPEKIVVGSVILISWQLDAEQTQKTVPSSAVIPKVLSGSWELEPHKGGAATSATYTVQLLCGGRLAPGGLPARAARVQTASQDRANSEAAARIGGKAPVLPPRRAQINGAPDNEP